MGRAFIGLALLAAAWLACLAQARADAAFLDDWGRGLDLTAAQQARARLILTEARAAADGAEADKTLCPAERAARYAAIERDVDLRLYRMLTPPQQDRFAVLHPDVMERLQAPAAAAAADEPKVDGGIGSGPPPTERRPAARSTPHDDQPTVADDDREEEPPPQKSPAERGRSRERPAADRPAISVPLPTFNVNVKMGGIPVPIPISLPPVQIRL